MKLAVLISWKEAYWVLWTLLILLCLILGATCRFEISGERTACRLPSAPLEGISLRPRVARF